MTPTAHISTAESYGDFISGALKSGWPQTVINRWPSGNALALPKSTSLTRFQSNGASPSSGPLQTTAVSRQRHRCTTGAGVLLCRCSTPVKSSRIQGSARLSKQPPAPHSSTRESRPRAVGCSKTSMWASSSVRKTSRSSRMFLWEPHCITASTSWRAARPRHFFIHTFLPVAFSMPKSANQPCWYLPSGCIARSLRQAWATSVSVERSSMILLILSTCPRRLAFFSSGSSPIDCRSSASNERKSGKVMTPSFFMYLRM
mmetsp:Transcript_13188/g.24358  ORF Transcript_13188/g.24358 Transcript_13188/m.24358 type:complete len:259 (+) Transcript_13188:298-1074(+)